MSDRTGFWSYVRQDDQDEGGRIVQLAHLMRARVRFLTGEEFQLFLDRDNLGWGEEWETRIREALLSTMFFIPVITPTYFQRESCREELLTFSSSARALGLEELILPIYYCTVPEFDQASPADELVALIKRYQWEDWRDVALEDSQSSTHRKAVDKLAQKLIAHAASADSKPVSAQVSVPDEPSTEPDAEEPDDSPGILERLAAGEAAFERLSQRVQTLPGIIEDLGSEANEAAQAIQRSDSQGKGFAGRLTVARQLANRFSADADKLEQMATGYLDDLIEVDAMVNTVINIVSEDPQQLEDAKGFLDVLVTLADSADEGLGSIESLSAIVSDSAKWSKDLKNPSRRIGRALRQMADTRTLFRQWRSHVEELRA
ncbi:MAG TPA: TIR domain-containing protein [Acidimicrobiales bacterium]|nr:TIR domain-containing protein [Acidimicrobiales bacterium]